MLLAADIAQIAAAAASAVARLEEAADENRAAVSQASDAPIEVLIAALNKLLSLLRELGEQRTGREPSPGAPLGPQDIGVLGDYGTDLLSQLSGWARRLNQSALAETFERLSLPLACWIARQGGEIVNLVPVVNTAAALANSLRHPPDLERLFLALSEIITAISPSVSQDLDRSNPGRPWRILLINHAIVATDPPAEAHGDWVPRPGRAPTRRRARVLPRGNGADARTELPRCGASGHAALFLRML
jgi:hypothetical protein